MSLWILMVVTTAAGGALVLWNQVSKLKHDSENLLARYSELLAESREKRRKQLEKEALVAEENEAQVDAASSPRGH